MADPLSLLRHFVINKKEIVERNGQIIFGDFAWPKDVKTNFVKNSLISSKDSTSKEYYTLDCLLYFLKNAGFSHTVYVRHAAAEDIPVVNRPDRKDLLAYFNGEISTCASIDRSMQQQFPLSFKLKLEKDENGNSLNEMDFYNIEEAKEQLVARFNKKEMSVKVDSLKSLSETMSVEKIASIKAKRLALKKYTIKDALDDSSSPACLKTILDYDAASTRFIQSFERTCDTRNSILSSEAIDFANNIFAHVEKVEGVEALKEQERRAKKRPAQDKEVYSRYDQEQYHNRNENFEEFNIDTMGSNVPDSLFKKPLPPPEPAQKPAKILKPIQSASLLMPIIVIPSVSSCLISMYNVKDILEKYNFVPTEELKRKGAKRDNEVIIFRKRGEKKFVPYRVIDQPLKLKKEEWNQIVAVFVQNTKWQFKGWPWNGDPVQIFSRIKAFHLRTDDKELDPNIAKCAVTVLTISRNHRHTDRAACAQFWHEVDNFLASKKTNLKF